MDLPESLPVWVYIVVALGGLGGVGSIIAAIVLYRKAGSDIIVTSKTAEKIDAETSDIISKAYRALLDQQQQAYADRYDAQGELTEALRARIRALETGNTMREKQHEAGRLAHEKRIDHLEAQLKMRDSERIEYKEHIERLENYVQELRKVMEEAVGLKGLKVPPLPDWFSK